MLMKNIGKVTKKTLPHFESAKLYTAHLIDVSENFVTKVKFALLRVLKTLLNKILFLCLLRNIRIIFFQFVFLPFKTGSNRRTDSSGGFKKQ